MQGAGVSASKRNFVSSIARKDILALDFDGVICNSAEESATTAMTAARAIWPTFNSRSALVRDDHLLSMLQNVRPIIETGYELVVVANYLQGAMDASGDEENASWRADTEMHLLDSWNPKFRDALIEQYASSKAALTTAFSAARDRRIQSDPKAWSRSNPLYEGIHSTLSGVDIGKLVIVTTKQQRFVQAILDHHKLRLDNGGISNAGSQPDSPAVQSNIFDLENRYGSKMHVLQELMRRHGSPQNARSGEGDRARPLIHFVEDRYETLLGVLRHRQKIVNSAEEASHSLLNVHLYLADWGYNTAAQRQAARNQPGIEVIDREDFQNLVKRVAGPFPP
jgi:phosphoglycolate phosphatase-like HAD superfamily hydrolase